MNIRCRIFSPKIRNSVDASYCCCIFQSYVVASVDWISSAPTHWRECLATSHEALQRDVRGLRCLGTCRILNFKFLICSLEFWSDCLMRSIDFFLSTVFFFVYTHLIMSKSSRSTGFYRTRAATLGVGVYRCPGEFSGKKGRMNPQSV